ncbi:MAG UNVERIFIED_CONTAM: hypothetical protein LVR29_15905 [Microcystis novacekii LVE1205-3]|jgi:hypothetical protein
MAKQAKRRNVNFKVNVPKKLPSVISDPNLLDQMLNGVVEKCTRSMASGQVCRYIYQRQEIN